MRYLLLLALLLTSFALADTPAQISADYRLQAAVAVGRVNQMLEKSTVPLIANLVASGDTISAEQLTTQLKSKLAGEPVPIPHASATVLFVQYDQARAKALEPAQKASIARIESMLKNPADLNLEAVTELSKIRAEIETASAAVLVVNSAGTHTSNNAKATSPPTSKEVTELVKKLGGSYTTGSSGDSISFSHTSISTSDLLLIGTAKRIKSFNWISGKGLTDDGMAAFAGMKKLDYLFLWDAGRITDAGLKHLSGCDKLEVLNIGGNGDGVTGAGLGNLAKCNSLRKLTLNYLPKFEGANLRHLSNLKSLKMLYLAACKNISDLDMDLISQMTQLTNLDLSKTVVTDAGLAKLTSLNHLQELTVSEPLVSQAGVGMLNKAIPNLKVTLRSK